MFRIRDLRGASGLLAVILALNGMAPVAHARNRKAEKMIKQGRAAEDRKAYDAALEFYEQALALDPNDTGYRILVQRTRFFACQQHVDSGQKIRDAGDLEKALDEFMRAIQKDPSSAIAVQEWKRTQEMIERAKSAAADPSQRGLTPAQQSQKEADDRIGSMLAPPDLKPISRVIQSLKINNQPPRYLYETVCKLAGLNVVFDPQYQNTSGRQNYNVELNNTSIENALDYLGVLTKTFWKPLTENTVFVAEDNVTKRRDYDDDVVKVFYVTNATSVQEFQEIATAIRSLTEIRRVYTYNAQKAMLIRGTVDQMALAEKLIRDLDKPKAEVVVDVIVMEANRGRTRDLAATLASGGKAGLNMPVAFTPRTSIAIPGTKTDDSTTTTTSIRTSNIGKIDFRDFTTTLPGALLSAILTDRTTRVMQSPQVRASDGQKVSLRIGDKIPIATGSFQPGIGGVGAGVSPLVSTQFNFTEVGVNVDMTPQVHGADEVTLKVSVEISTVRDRVDLGGISQPVIGQRKSETELRLREGEVNILGGLTNAQDSRLVSGVPGLVNMPILGRIFGSENVEKNQQELLIALVPHIVRTPGYTPDNLRAVYAGTDQQVRVTFAPKKEAPPPPPVVTPQPAKPATPAPSPTTPAATTPAANPVLLTFSPGGDITAAPGSTISLALQIVNGQDLFAAGPVRIKYDASKLRLNDIVQGELLARDGQRVSFSKDIRNDSGEATLTITRPAGAPGIGGSGSLFTLTFQGVGAGESRITLEEIGLKNPQAQTMPVGSMPQVKIRLQ
jgi:general secretion pathway protein D